MNIFYKLINSSFKMTMAQEQNTGDIPKSYLKRTFIDTYSGDLNNYEITGTSKQISSAVYELGGGDPFDSGAIVLKNGRNKAKLGLTIEQKRKKLPKELNMMSPSSFPINQESFTDSSIKTLKGSLYEIYEALSNEKKSTSLKSAKLKFKTRDSAEDFALKWSRYSKRGHIIGPGKENVEVTIFDVTESDVEWIDNYALGLNESQQTILSEQEIEEIDQYVEKIKKETTIIDSVVSLIPKDYKNPFDLNRAIEKLIDFKSENETDWTNEELRFISEYSGYGGLEKYGDFSDEELIGLLYEYYTDDEIVKKMWALAYKHGFGTINNPTILEPSVGVGAFLKYAPQKSTIFGYDVNDYSVKISRLLYPTANITKKPFEKLFIERNNTIKNKVSHLQHFDLVIGNPPYGKATSRYLSMGELAYSKASNWIEYFITRGLDLVKKDGLLIYIVGAEQYNGGKMFLDSPDSEVKRSIFAKSTLLEAYRLPTNLFKRTGVSTEILIFKKK